MGILNKFKVLAQVVFHNVAGVSFVWFNTLLTYAILFYSSQYEGYKT